MKKQGVALVLSFILFASSISSSLAAPLINEFSSGTTSDWVELYNEGSETIDLSLYRLRDLTATNKKDLSGNLDPGDFATFDWSNKLNNAGDLIKLVLISDESIVDQTTYGDQGGIDAPDSTQTGGRKNDGGSQWVLFNSSSKGSSNNSSEVYVPPTPTNTPVPTPTKTPKPTKTPTPIKTKTVKTSTGSTSTSTINTNSNTKKNTSPSPKKPTSGKITNESDDITKSNVLGVDEKDNKDQAGEDDDKNLGMWISIITGFLFILIGVVAVIYKYGKDNDIFTKIFNKYKR